MSDITCIYGGVVICFIILLFIFFMWFTNPEDYTGGGQNK